MGLVKISELTAANSLTGDEDYVFNQSGNTKRGNGSHIPFISPRLDGMGALSSEEDTAAIQAAIDASSGNEVIEIGPTNVVLSEPLVINGRNLKFRGAGQSATTIQAPSGQGIFALTGAFPSGGEATIELSGVKWLGNDAGSQLLDVSAAPTFAEGRFSLTDSVLRGFGTYALTLRQSFYYSSIERCFFYINAGAIDIYEYCDSTIRDCTFSSSQNAPHIRAIGPNVKILGCNFHHGDAPAGTQPDILFRAINDHDIGYNLVGEGCNFGPEGDVAGRYKIVVEATNAAYVHRSVRILGNSLRGVAGQTCYRFNTPIDGWEVDHNDYAGFTNLVSNNSSVPYVSGVKSRWGAGNRYICVTSSTTPAWKTFANNDSRGWSIVGNGAEAELPTPTIASEQYGLVNRLTQSEDLSHADWTKSGITVTTGQTDSLGTTRAVKLTRANASGSEQVRSAFSNTNMLNTAGEIASGPNGVVTVSLGVKAGTLNSAVLALRNSTTGINTALQQIQFGTGWRRRPVNFAGLDPTTGYQLSIYPGSIAQMAGDMYVEFVQVSDRNSDYVPVAGAPVFDNTIGARYERSVKLASAAHLLFGDDVDMARAAANLLRLFDQFDIQRTNASDAAITAARAADAAARIQIRADGQVSFGPGNAALDAIIRRGGVGYFMMPFLVKAGVPADGDYDIAPPDGTLAINSSTNKIYCRIAGTFTQVTA